MKSDALYKFAIIVSILFVIGCVSTLKDYKPVSEDEEEIKRLLMEWESTWNNHDVQSHLALWNENANIMYGSDRKIASKQEYVDILPERMQAISSLSLGMPEITTYDNKADVEVDIKVGQHTTSSIMHLVKQKGRWTFMSWEY